MGMVTIQLGVRKFRVPEANAVHIDRIIEAYSPSGTGRLLIARHLVRFDGEDLVAFENWQQTGVARSTHRFPIPEDYERWHRKFKLIAAEITGENNLSDVTGCSC